MLRKFFKEKNVSTTKLANYLKVKPQRVNNWLLRKTIPPYFIRAVAEYIGISTEELLKIIETAKNTQQKGSTHA